MFSSSPFKPANPQQSFESLRAWLKELKLRDPDKLNILAIAGNKSDLKEKRQVTYKDGKAFADEYDAIFFETSAKTGQAVNDIFHAIGLSRFLGLISFAVPFN